MVNGKRSFTLQTTIKQVLAWTFILGGVLVGIISVVYGVRKAYSDKEKFMFFHFLKKLFKKTEFQAYTGYEIVGLGFLSILGAALIYVLCFL